MGRNSRNRGGRRKIELVRNSDAPFCDGRGRCLLRQSETAAHSPGEDVIAMRQKLITGPVVGPAQPKLPGVDPPSSVATRGGVEDLLPQLYYQARVRGMAQAQ